MLRIGKQSISYRLFDIHIHYVNETDSSSHTEKYIYVAHIDYIAHNAQEMNNMTLVSHTAKEILNTWLRGETICALDSGTHGQDDVLIGSIEHCKQDVLDNERRDVFDEDDWALCEIGEGDEPLRSIIEDALEKLEEKYETFCNLIAKAEGIHDFFVEGCGLEGDWGGMPAREKITALEDALIECDRHATYYDSMYEYVDGADISHYRCSTAEDDPDEIMIAEFSPADDPDFAIDPDHTIEVDTVRYVPVCWGEDGLSLLREDALEEVCFVRYMYNPQTREYVSDGRVYETREEAEQSA